MTLSLDQILQIGPFKVAALSRTKVTPHHSNSAATIFGHKTPVAVLVRHGDNVQAFKTDGAPMLQEDIEILCPGAWQDMLNAAD